MSYTPRRRACCFVAFKKQLPLRSHVFKQVGNFVVDHCVQSRFVLFTLASGFKDLRLLLRQQPQLVQCGAVSTPLAVRQVGHVLPPFTGPGRRLFHVFPQI